MKNKKYLCALLALNLATTGMMAQAPAHQDSSKVIIKESEKTLNTQWKGKKVAFLGDSMTDKGRVGTKCVYWEYLTELLGIEPMVYGINGHEWTGIYQQAVKLKEEKGSDVDAILIFAGTNDYNNGLPLGKFFKEETKEVNHNGNKVMRRYRTPIMTDTTFCGRVNKVMNFLKENFPTQQIVLMTPIHRAFASFGAGNVQPDENYCNPQGLYLESYVEVLKQTATYWSVPSIDLHSLSGLFPLADSQVMYFHHSETDRLHPNAIGDYRLARTIQYQLLALPATFK